MQPFTESTQGGVVPPASREQVAVYFDSSVSIDSMYAMDGRTSATGIRSLSPWLNRSLSFMKSGLTP